jgi:hypothetical protein
MNLKGIFLVVFLALCSGLVVNAQALLTAKPWHLYQKIRGGKKSLLHKPSDEDFVFTFYADGKLLNQKRHGKTENHYTWKWENSNHKKMFLRKDNDSLRLPFHVKELTATKLVVYVADAKGKNIYQFTFRHADEAAWLKEDVDAKNAARKDSVLIEKPEATP